MNPLGIVYTVGLGGLGSTCGYCSPPGQRSAQASSFHDAELEAASLRGEGYQAMIDRGWRRCGTFCYRPDMKRTCCPQYTIKLDALKFRASPSQRKLISRWNRFVSHGDGPNESHKAPKPKHAKKGAPEYSLVESIHASEKHTLGEGLSEHTFEVTLEPSSYTEEKYQLFDTYQASVHNDSSSPYGFKRFLVETPLTMSPIPYSSTPPEHLPKLYGSYHQLYRLDGKLIAIGFLDILPSCVSSVYFAYDPAFEKHSLGKISALREVSLVKEIHDAGLADHQYLYLGYYVHTCPKMLYKGEYSPSYLLDPEEFTWHPLEECKKELDRTRYACFAHPEHSSTTPASQEARPSWRRRFTSLGFSPTMPEIPLPVLESLIIIVNEDGGPRIGSFSECQWSDEPAVKGTLSRLVHALGYDLAKRLAYQIQEWS